MRISINITKEEANHILPFHTFEDCCGVVEDIMRKVQIEAMKMSRKSRFF